MKHLRERGDHHGRGRGAVRNRGSGSWRIGTVVASAAVIAAVGAGCNQPLPEDHTEAAQLYASRCGQCHRAYAPGSLPAAMWEVQVQMMDAKMRQLNVPPLTDQERQTILSYLARNAAHE
jgi:mono/diheme cytochrome c family protein